MAPKEQNKNKEIFKNPSNTFISVVLMQTHHLWNKRLLKALYFCQRQGQVQQIIVSRKLVIFAIMQPIHLCMIHVRWNKNAVCERLQDSYDHGVLCGRWQKYSKQRIHHKCSLENRRLSERPYRRSVLDSFTYQSSLSISALPCTARPCRSWMVTNLD